MIEHKGGTKMNEVIIAWVEIVAVAIITLHMIASFIITKFNNKTIVRVELILVLAMIVGFCVLLYIAIIGIYYTTWVSYGIIALALLLLLALGKRYLRDLKEATAITKRWINTKRRMTTNQ